LCRATQRRTTRLSGKRFPASRGTIYSVFIFYTTIYGAVCLVMECSASLNRSVSAWRPGPRKIGVGLRPLCGFSLPKTSGYSQNIRYMQL
jgi:hypothetical protein